MEKRFELGPATCSHPGPTSGAAWYSGYGIFPPRLSSSQNRSQMLDDAVLVFRFAGYAGPHRVERGQPNHCRHGRIRPPHREPDDLVQHPRIGHVRMDEVLLERPVVFNLDIFRLDWVASSMSIEIQGV